MLSNAAVGKLTSGNSVPKKYCITVFNLRMITGSCPITMCKSKAVPKEDPPIEIETTNVGFVNTSESAVSTIGIGEIISTIILVMII